MAATLDLSIKDLYWFLINSVLVKRSLWINDKLLAKNHDVCFVGQPAG